jgi:hypothetical protein
MHVPFKFRGEKSAMTDILFVGNFLSASRGNRTCAKTSRLLFSLLAVCMTVSDKPGLLSRVLEFLLTMWRERHRYRIAHVDVYSGFAFITARNAVGQAYWD